MHTIKNTYIPNSINRLVFVLEKQRISSDVQN
jgi:hypothetical protein